MDVMPRFSIVMPAYNVAPYITEAMESVLAQDVGDWELIVVDDASEDDTLAVARRIDDPRIRFFSRPHAGLGGTLNFGIGEARGDYLLFLDSDDVLASGSLRRLHARLAQDPEAVAVYSNFWIVDEDGRKRALRNFVPRPLKPSGDILRHLLARNVVAALGSALIRAGALRAIGCFDAAISMGVDWEMWCRLAMTGRIIYARGFRTLSYRQRGASMTAVEGIDVARYAPAIDKVFGSTALAARFSEGELGRLHRKQMANAYCLMARKHAEAGQYERSLRYFWDATRLDKRRLPWLAAGLLRVRL